MSIISILDKRYFFLFYPFLGNLTTHITILKIRKKSTYQLILHQYNFAHNAIFHDIYGRSLGCQVKLKANGLSGGQNGFDQTAINIVFVEVRTTLVNFTLEQAWTSIEPEMNIRKNISFFLLKYMNIVFSVFVLAFLFCLVFSNWSFWQFRRVAKKPKKCNKMGYNFFLSNHQRIPYPKVLIPQKSTLWSKIGWGKK